MNNTIETRSCRTLTKSDSCWFITFSGVQFFPLNPYPSDILLMDIAHALSQINRFGGHTRIPYSVAAHSLLVAALLPPGLKLQGLLHDATEAYIGDMVSPVKKLIPDFCMLEKNLWKVIAKRFSLPEELDPQVKEADLLALKMERDQFIKNKRVWPVDCHPFSSDMRQRAGWVQVPLFKSSEVAADTFRTTFYEWAKIEKPFNNNQPKKDQ